MHRARVTLVGHPFAPHGMGEHLRATFRALRAAGVDARVRDLYAMYDAEAHETNWHQECKPPGHSC